MDGADLTITLFILGCAIPFALEAFKVSGRLRWTLGGIAFAFVCMGILWLPIAHTFPRVAAFVSPIAKNPLAWFMLAFALVAIAREWWSKQPKSSGGPDLAKLDADHASAPVVAMWAGKEPDTTTTAAMATRADALSKTVAEDVKALRDLVQKSFAGATLESQELGRRIDQLNARLRAQGDRHRMQRIEPEIEKADTLLFFPNGEGIEGADWDTWKSVERKWRSIVQAWCRVAQSYTGDHDPWSLVTNTPEDDYYGTWSFDASKLPDADTVYRYKTFCIMRRNLTVVREEAESNSLFAAYP